MADGIALRSAPIEDYHRHNSEHSQHIMTNSYNKYKILLFHRWILQGIKYECRKTCTIPNNQHTKKIQV